jgi:predicted DsbA family dithiol-disulfide isomerase
VKEDMGAKLSIKWKYFSLEQVNSQNGRDWKLWDQPEDYPSRGRRAFHAAEAARRQGGTAFDRFHMALLQARHERKWDIADIKILIEVAKNTGLDVSQFQADLGDSQLLTRLAEDHTLAVEVLGVFGTPTLVFSARHNVFLKMRPSPPPEECLQLFKEVHHLAEQRPYVQEIKRPTLISSQQGKMAK